MSPPKTSAVVSNRASALGSSTLLTSSRRWFLTSLNIPLILIVWRCGLLAAYRSRSSRIRILLPTVTRISLMRSALFGLGSAQTIRRRAGRLLRVSPAPRRGGSPGYNFELLLCPYLRKSLAVHADHGLVFPADDEQRGCCHTGQCFPRQVGTPAARDDRANRIRAFCRRDQCGPCPRTGAEVADPEVLRVRLLCQPVGGVREPVGEQPDIESEVARPEIHLLLFGREEVDEQGSKPCFAQNFGDVAVAGTVPARTGAVGEEHDPPSVGDAQVSFEGGQTCRNPNLALFHRSPPPFQAGRSAFVPIPPGTPEQHGDLLVRHLVKVFVPASSAASARLLVLSPGSTTAR